MMRIQGGHHLASRRAAGAILAAAVAAIVAGCGSSNHVAAPATTTPAVKPVKSVAKTPPKTQRQTPAKVALPSQALIATAPANSLAVYHSPSSAKPFRRLTPLAPGAPLTLLVRKRQAGFDQVYLPVRPDGSTGWVKANDVQLTKTDYALGVDLSSHQLVVAKDGKVIERMPVADGRPGMPTPTGYFYLADLLKQPDSSGQYGPYAFGLSAYSNVLDQFDGGPGQIGLHGTNVPSSIGHSVSHGCVRVLNQDVSKLASMLPLGTPIVIRK